MDTGIGTERANETKESRRGADQPYDDARPAPKKDAPPEGKQDKPKDDKEGDKPERDKNDDKQPMSRGRKWLYGQIGGAVLLALIVGGVLYWLHARPYESTDDAFIDGFMSQIAPQVAGRVTSLAVRDNEMVKAGQLLVEIDPRDQQVKLDQARAQRANAVAQADQARAQVLVQQANVDQASANVRVAEADLQQATQDLARYRGIDPKAITRQQLDQASAAAKSANARLDAARQTVTGAQAQVAASQAQVEAAEAAVRAADADIRIAELQLSYTRVVAPVDGRVTKRTVDVGNYVNPGQVLLAIVPRDVWVTANFKETQLTLIREGQPVQVSVDAFPDRKLPGRVDSVQSGTGAVFRSLPAENATGNYVKVVQRVPVKITFVGDEWRDLRLAPGMSVVPRVTVRPED